MKAVLHLKFIVLYIIFGFLCVFTTATLTTELITERLEKDTSQTLYREATMIADNYLPSYFSKEKEMDEEALKILKIFELDTYADTNASNLPYGKQRKLEIARALATNPKLLLLDEPAAGMNPNETKELMETIELIRKEFKVTILLIEHDMKPVSGICEYLYVLNFGTELAHGTPAEVLNDPKVVKAYLGE